MYATTEELHNAVLKLPKDEPIRGRLINLEGQPVAGARVRVIAVQTGADDTLNEFVRLWSPEKKKQQQALHTLAKSLWTEETPNDYLSATTDADGRFTLTGIGLNRCPQLTVSARGLASHAFLVPIHPDFKPPAGPGAGSLAFGTVFTLPLTPAKPITGVVRDSEKKPLAGVRVFGQPDRLQFPLPGEDYRIVPPDALAVTNARGEYVLDGLPKAKKYILLADPKPGEGSVHQFAVRSDESPGFAALTADFDLPRGVVLTGRITDKKTGKPIQAFVSYNPLESNKWLKEHPDYDTTQSDDLGYQSADTRTETDAEGRFKLTAVPGPGILHVQILSLALAQEYLPAKLAPEDDTDEIMEKAGLLQFFKTKGLGRIYAPRYLHAYRVLRIPADAKTITADATVARGVNRVVKIVGPDDKPVSGAWVLNDKIWGTTGNGLVLVGSEFTARALDPDTPRRIYAQQDDKKLAGFMSLDGKETGPAVLRLQSTATVSGRVVDREGKPRKDYCVSPVYDDPEIGQLLQYRWGATVDADADGKFTLPNIPAGLTVRFEARLKVSPFQPGPIPTHGTPKQTLKAGEILNLGEWKPK